MVKKEDENIIILGAGISGLATAHWLKKKGYNEIKIIEEKSQPGGSLITKKEKDFLIDFGPNSGLETSPVIKELIDDVGLSEEMIYSNKVGDRRYILRNNLLHALPVSAKSFFKTKLFSAKGKARIFLEPFIGKSEDGYYQSLADFVQRRLSKEFLDYAIDPFVSGVFAGSPEKLSVKSAFPKLYRLEELYGGLIKGMIKGMRERKKSSEKSKHTAKMFSFINGMQSLPNAISKEFSSQIFFNSKVKSVTLKEEKYLISFYQNETLKEITADTVISTLPAYVTGKVLTKIDENIEKKLEQIYYPPVMVLYIAYNKSDIKRPLDGFGFLIPQKEKKNFLGAIWTSNIFINRATENKASFTLFAGGSRSPELLEDVESLKKKIIAEFNEIMGIEKSPIFIKEKLWHKAIPQYNIGYIEYEKYCDKMESDNKGLFISGNFRKGISLGDCIKNSYIVAEKINNYIENKGAYNE